MSLTAKHMEFVNTPMGTKPVTAVPGIGPVIGGNMATGGITTAKQLHGYYLIDPSGFKACVMRYGADNRRQEAAYQAMSAYDQQYN